METPEEMVEAYKKKQKEKIAQEDQQMVKTILQIDNMSSDFQKLVKELHTISQELKTLNQILRRK